jgi:osmotically-inducible protein OsmY
VYFITTEAGFPSSLLSVSVGKPGKIQVSGIVQTESTRTKAEAILKGVKGIEPVDNHIQISTSALWSPH